MSAFVCPHCGEATEIFGRGGGERFAQRHELDFFGGIPLDVKVRQGGDAGVPAVAQREPGPAAEVLRDLARQVAARMSVRAAQRGAGPEHQLTLRPGREPARDARRVGTRTRADALYSRAAATVRPRDRRPMRCRPTRPGR